MILELCLIGQYESISDNFVLESKSLARQKFRIQEAKTSPIDMSNVA